MTARKVRAAVVHAAGGPLDLREVDLRDPGPGEVLVRVDATGVCASDVHVIDGALPKPMPIVPGHEAAGTVVALGDDDPDRDAGPALEVGGQVVLSILPWCGRCAACTRGRRNSCTWAGQLAGSGTLPDGRTAFSLDGGPLHHFTGVSSWADHVVVPRTGCIPVPSAVPPQAAALLGCAVATGVGAVRNAADVAPGDTAAVVGCGGVGLNAVQGLAMAGASTIVAVDRNAGALDLAARLGATHVVDARDRPVDEAIRSVLPDGADHVLECVGRPETIEAAWRATTAGGETVVVGLPPAGSAVTLGAFDFIAEKRVVGTYLGGVRTDRDIPALADDYLAGDLQLDPLVNPIGFDDLPAAVDALRDGRVLARQVVVWDH